MPTYDYQCRSCGHTIEVIHSMLESGPSTCERCGGDLRRVIYPAGIIFKGGGFYKTDSRASGAAGSTVDAASKPASATDATPSTGGGDGTGASSASTTADAPKEAPKKV